MKVTTMNKKIKLAFLGGGINSAVGRTHRIAIEMDRRYELVAGCFSRNDETNVDTAKEYEVDLNRCYKNLDELIKNELESHSHPHLNTPYSNEILENPPPEDGALCH